MRFIAALIVLLVPVIAARDTEPPINDPFFDHLAALELLDLDDSARDKVRKILEAIEESEAAFHRARIARETEALIRKEPDRGRSLEISRAEILAKAAAAQERIDALAAEAAGLLSGEQRERFLSLPLPRLMDPGRPVFGTYRRNLPGVEGVGKTDLVVEAAAGSLIPKVTFSFSHEEHPDMKTGCKDCHGTPKRSAIEAAFGKDLLSKGRKPDAPEIPTMEGCLECHNERGAIDECELCHPSLERGKSSLSRKFNPFDRLKVGIPAPPFALSTQGGQKVSLSRFLGKRLVVIRFGSSTHAAFLDEAAAMANLARRYAGKPVVFFTIYTAESHPEAIAGENWLPKSRAGMALRANVCLDVLAGKGIPDKSVWLVDEWPAKVSLLYGGRPGSVFVVDRSGKIAWKSPDSAAAALGTALDEQIEKIRLH